MATRRIICPCTKTCTNRTTYCRLSCPEFKSYEAAKKEEYAERAKEAQVRDACIETNYRFKKWRYFAR